MTPVFHVRIRCPDNAVIELDPADGTPYAIDLDYC